MSARWRGRVSLVAFIAVFAPVYLATRMLTLLLRLVAWPRWWPLLQPRLGIRKRVLFLEVFFPEASGYVYRVTNWARVLERAGFTTRVRHPLSERSSRALLAGGWTGLFYAAYLLRRLPQCLTAPFFNCVVVRRELLLFDDYGNLFLERLLLALNPHTVLDFDDDIAAAKREPRQLSVVGRLLRESPTKFGDCLRFYPSFIAGSGYLRRLALDERKGIRADIEVIPTCVSYDDAPAKRYGAWPATLTLGWIGTDGNLEKLARIVPDIEELAGDVALRLLVISGRGLDVTASFPIENRRWSLATQVADLLEIDVGVMPLVDSRAERGKCGFKQIQYMGLGIVGIASAITTNREIVTHGVDGFLVETGEDWADALRGALAEWERFPAIGAAAREKVAHHYSVDAHADAYLAFIARNVSGSTAVPA